MGGFAGGSSNQKGISPKTSERQQRLNETISRFGLEQGLDQQALYNYFLTGQFDPSSIKNSGKLVTGNLTAPPTGPAAGLVTSGLTGEQDLSNQRQAIANQILGQAPGQLDLINAFGQGTLNQASGGLQGQSALLAGLLGQQPANLNLNQQLTGNISDFFTSGGAPSDAQRQQIGDIFNAQREIGTSNLQQQFGDALQQLQEHATSRGLRFGDTPIQDRGNRLSEELVRNLANLETSLGGQQANALLEAPFRQATLGGQLQGQSQNQFLNALNAFSVPVNQGFNQASQLLGNQQFGLGFSPANISGAALQNLSGLLGGGQFSTGTQGFSPIGVAQAPSFGQLLGSNFASNFGGQLGGGLGQASAFGLTGGVSSIGQGPGGSTPQTAQQASILQNTAGSPFPF